MIGVVAACVLSQFSPVGDALLRHMQQGVGEARVGQWVTYDLSGGHFWRLSIVGEEKDRKGRDAYWIEIEIGESASMRAPLQQLRALVAKGQGLDSSGITRMFIAFGYEPARELDDSALAWMLKSHPKAPTADAPGPGMFVRNGREARLMTPAGTVSALPVEIGARQTVLERIWMSRDVPILHVAKVELPAIGHLAEVWGYGLDARPRMVLPSARDPKIGLERYDRTDGSP